jgi:23S rRNA (pseudouridine1915-N3)-methyltransferase
MSKFAVLTVGKPGQGWAEEAVSDYAQRTRRWGGIEAIWVPIEPFRGDVERVREAESAKVLGRLGERDRLVVLDERGDDLDTKAFTALLDAARQQSVPRLVFAIGGAYGHGPATRARAHRVVRLSSLVLNHEVARVVLYEQLYRGLAALHGVPYAH